MKRTIDSKTRREKIRNLHLIEQEQYKACEKSKKAHKSNIFKTTLQCMWDGMEGGKG